MKRKITFVTLLVLLAPAILGASTALAEEGYTLDWWRVNSGGGESVGGDYTLKGTVGLHDAGEMEGGDYTVRGGFWVSSILNLLDFIIHLPLVLRGF
jgi:hypothetical protein